MHGEPKTGAAAAEGQALLKRGTVDLSLLDEKVEALCTKLLYTFPECTTKTVEELRKPKLNAWNANKENARDWLALNMMTEGRAGFPRLQRRHARDRAGSRFRGAAPGACRKHAVERRTHRKHHAAGEVIAVTSAAQDLVRGGRPPAAAAAE